MNGFYEALKGFTDVPIALVALAFWILSKRNNRKEWGNFFLLLFLTASLGAVAHAFALPEALWRSIWAVVFAGLFEIVFLFTKLFGRYVNSSINFNEKTFRWLQVVFCLAAIIAVAGFGHKEMLIFVVYSFCCIAFLVRCFIGTSNVPQNATIFVLLLPVLLLMQTFNTVIPYAVDIEHIVLTVMLFVLYSISKGNQEGVLPCSM